jgi:hypothetical protein
MTDEEAIQAILQQFETAWNVYDSVSLAALCRGCQLHPHLWGAVRRPTRHRGRAPGHL